MGFGKGIANVGENLGLGMMQIESAIWDLKGDYEQAEAVRQKMANADYIFTGNISKAQENIDKYSASGSTLDKTMETAGYMTALWASETVGGGIGQSAMTIGNTAGQTFADLYREHGTDLPQWAVWLKGIGSGAIEDRVERLGGFFGSTGATNKLTASLMSKTKSGIGKALISMGMSANDEGLEEVAGYVLNSFLDKTIDFTSNLTGDNLKLAKKWDWNELAKDYGFAFISTLLTGGARDMSKITALGLSNDMKFSDAVEEFGKLQEKGLNDEIKEKELEKELKKTQDANERVYIQNQLNELKEPENGFKDFFSKLQQGVSEEQAIQNNLSEPSQMIPVAENTEMMYNNTEGEIENEFRRVQEASRNLSTQDTEMYHSGEKQLDEGVRRRLSEVLGGELRTKSSSIGYGNASFVNPNTNESRGFYTDVDADSFHDTMEIVQKFLRNGDAVDVHNVEDYKNTKNYLSEDGLSGFAITQDGDLISVFNMGAKGYLDTISEEVKKNAKTLDCFQSEKQPLADMYEKKLGFKKASIMDFNYDFLVEEKGKEYADYFVKTYGEAPVVFMVNTDQDVETKHFNKDQYDEAVQYRDSFLNKASTNNQIDNVTIDYDNEKINVENSYKTKEYEESRAREKEITQKIIQLENEISEERKAEKDIKKARSEQMRKKHPGWDNLSWREKEFLLDLEYFDDDVDTKVAPTKASIEKDNLEKQLKKEEELQENLKQNEFKKQFNNRDISLGEITNKEGFNTFRDETGWEKYDNYLRDKEQAKKDGYNFVEVVEMSPDEYLTACSRFAWMTPIEDGLRADYKNVNGYAERFNNELNDVDNTDKAYMPFLRIDGANTPGGQEGRHRALALKKLGIDKMPVLLMSKENLEVKDGQVSFRGREISNGELSNESRESSGTNERKQIPIQEQLQGQSSTTDNSLENVEKIENRRVEKNAQEEGSFNLPEKQEAPQKNVYTTSKDNYKTPAKEGTIRLYTNTSAKNIDNILKNGLQTDKARQLEYDGQMLWFETRPDLKGYGGTTIAVDVPVNSQMEKVNDTQYTVFDNISPENIVFVDKPIFGTYRTSDLQNLVDKFGKEKVLNVFDKTSNKFISKEELQGLLDNIEDKPKVPQAQVLEQEPMNEANMDNLLQEVDKQVAPVQQKQELPKKKNGKYQSVIESSTNTRIVDKRNKVPLKQTLEKVKKLGEDIYQATVNQRYFTDKLAKKVGNDKLIYKGDKALSSGATANFVIDRKQTNYNNTKVVGDSVNGIIERAKKDKVYEPLNDYLYLKNHADRKEQGKGFLGLSVEEANQKANDLMQRYPKIKEYAKEIHDFCHNELQVLVDSGVISEKWATAWEKMYPNYVPVFSQLSGKIEDNIESDTVTGGRGVKKAKGGTYDIAPIDIALANYTTKIRRAVATNNFIKELATSINMAENGTNEGLETYEIIEPESLFEETNAPVQEIDGKYQGIYFENGVAYPFELTKDLYKSAKEISTDTIMDRIGKTIGLQKFTELQRNLQTTYNLPFGVVNYLKDAQAGLYNSKNPLNYEKNVPLAWKELVTNNNKTKNYKSGDTLSTLDTFLANGGLMASYFNSEEGTISNSKGIRGKLANANASIEMSHRVAEYMSTMELREKSLRKQLEADGLSKKEIDSIVEEQKADWIDEAVYNASEITTNFKRGGAFVKMLNRNGFNYLNASVQGFDRFVRTATRNRTVGEWAGFISKVALLGIAPAIANNLILGDDDDYKKLRDNDKDLYYLIKIPGGDGKFWRIPKGRELSTFGAWARRTEEAVEGKGLEAYKGLGETVSNQVAPNNPLTDNVFAPLIQAKNNKTWWGGEIVKGQMKDKPASEQYDEYTDDFSKFLGSKLNISPKKINYALNQYSGGIGDIILPSITTATKGSNPVKNVFKDKFTVDSVLKNRLSTDFYNLVDKQEALAKMTNASDEDKLKNKYLNTMKKELYQFYDEKDKVLNDESLSYEEKQAKVREIQKELNSWMEDTMANYDKIEKVDDDISKIKDEYYIKNKGGKYAGEWRELYDNEVEEMNTLKKSGISEKDYLRYKQDNTYYDDEGKAHQKKTIEKIDYMVNNMDLDDKQLDSMYKETVGSEDKTYKKYSGSAKSYLQFKLDSDKQKQKRTSDSNASVSQADKMNALIDGKYTNKERQELYDTFASEDDYVYKTLKKTNIDVREYLKYKQADLKADRQDNGTLNGKTISGTAKAKTIAYINNMNITYDQKLILMGTRYKMSNAERERVAYYINSLRLSQKDKLEMYNKMKGFTAYKDGRVTW